MRLEHVSGRVFYMQEAYMLIDVSYMANATIRIN